MTDYDALVEKAARVLYDEVIDYERVEQIARAVLDAVADDIRAVLLDRR